MLTPSLLTTPANAIFLIRNSCYPLNQSSFTQWQFNYILLYPHSGKWLYYFHQPRSLQCNSRWKNNQKPNYSTWRSMNFSVYHCFVCQFRFSVQKFYRLLFMVTFEPMTHDSVIFVVRNAALFITTGNIYVSLKSSWCSNKHCSTFHTDNSAWCTAVTPQHTHTQIKQIGGKRDATAPALQNTTHESRAAILKKLLRGALQR